MIDAVCADAHHLPHIVGQGNHRIHNRISNTAYPAKPTAPNESPAFHNNFKNRSLLMCSFNATTACHPYQVRFAPRLAVQTTRLDDLPASMHGGSRPA
jgi:hypothetical protein